jgi:uncharacterized tellurite resistance protein B-like protein
MKVTALTCMVFLSVACGEAGSIAETQAALDSQELPKDVVGCDARHVKPRVKWTARQYSVMCFGAFKLLRRQPDMALADAEEQVDYVAKDHAKFCSSLKRIAPDRRLALAKDLPVAADVKEAREEYSVMVGLIEKGFTPSTLKDPVRRERSLRNAIDKLMYCPASFQATAGSISYDLGTAENSSIHTTAGGDQDFTRSMADDELIE